MRHEDRVRPLRHVDGIVVGQVQQDREHADVHVGEVTDAFAQHRRGVSREVLAPLQQHEVERLVGAEVLPDERLDARRRSSLSSRMESCTSKIAASSAPACASARVAQVAQPFARPLEGAVQALRSPS